MAILIQPLQSKHDRGEFDCGVEALNAWLQQTAQQHSRKGISRTFVAVDEAAQQRILGFYSLTASEAESPSLPDELRKKLPRKVPIVLLGRLARATSMRGKALGELLLVDALRRIVNAAQEVGIAAILVDAKDEAAARFYEKFGFVRLPDTPDRLIMSISTARTALA
jgi:predicted GNAT family N-acyltransferase